MESLKLFGFSVEECFAFNLLESIICENSYSLRTFGLSVFIWSFNVVKMLSPKKQYETKLMVGKIVHYLPEWAPFSCRNVKFVPKMQLMNELIAYLFGVIIDI